MSRKERALMHLERYRILLNYWRREYVLEFSLTSELKDERLREIRARIDAIKERICEMERISK